MLDSKLKQPINILLVEDSEADLKITLMAFELAELNAKIHVAHDGEEALDFVYNRNEFEDKKVFPRPDILLLDLNMPKLGGLDVLAVIKADDKLKHIPVIILTSSRNEEDVARTYREGGATYIQKPIDFDGFMEVVDGFKLYWEGIATLPGKLYDDE